MRVNTLTLATASAAALTIGLAAPAFASPTLEHQGLRAQGGYGQFLPHEAAQALVRDGDGDGDGDCRDGGGCGDGDSFSSRRHCGSFSSCRGLFGGRRSGIFGGGFGGFGGGFGGDDCGSSCGPSGEGAEWSESGKFAKPQRAAAAAVPHARVPLARPGRMVVHRRQVARIPRRAVPTGFGGSQGANLPLGIAGLSLILGGAGLLPLARRRIRTSERA